MDRVAPGCSHDAQCRQPVISLRPDEIQCQLRQGLRDAFDRRWCADRFHETDGQINEAFVQRRGLGRNLGQYYDFVRPIDEYVLAINAEPRKRWRDRVGRTTCCDSACDGRPSTKSTKSCRHRSGFSGSIGEHVLDPGCWYDRSAVSATTLHDQLTDPREVENRACICRAAQRGRAETVDRDRSRRLSAASVAKASCLGVLGNRVPVERSRIHPNRSVLVDT